MKNQDEPYDEGFAQRYLDSLPHVERVFKWLQSKGHDVELIPSKLSPTFEDRAAYSDAGDIVLHTEKGDEIIEVKHLIKNGAWTGADDFPNFGRPRHKRLVLVDGCEQWDKKHPKPYLYIVTNGAVTHCYYIDRNTRKYWQKLKLFDPYKGFEVWKYLCPIQFARFVSMND